MKPNDAAENELVANQIKDKGLLKSKPSFMAAKSPIGLIVTELDGTIISFNKAVQKMIGLKATELHNRNVTGLYAELADRRRLLRLLSKSHSVQNFDAKIRHSDGSLRTLLANVDSIILNEKHLLLTSLYDITPYAGKKQNQSAAAKSYQQLFYSAPVGIIVADFSGRLIISNHAVQELLGYPPETLKSTNIQEAYVRPADRQKLLALTREKGTVRDFETILRHQNGHVITVLINTDIIDFQNHKHVLLTSIRDISRLKAVEDNLTQERDFSNAILNIAFTLIIVLDQHGMIVRFNHACEQLTEYSFEEVKDTYYGDAKFIETTASGKTADQLLDDEQPATYHSVWVAKSGARHLLSWTKTTLLDSKGRVEYLLATGIDITKQQRATEELKIRLLELQERTDEMTHLNQMGEQLQSCQTIAEAGQISVGFIRRIYRESHGGLYLRNPNQNVFESLQLWGTPAYTTKKFPETACFALVQHRLYSSDSHGGTACQHLDPQLTGQAFCLPLMSENEVIGLLHINHLNNPLQFNPVVSSTYINHRTQLLTMIAEYIALALTNIRLRETLRQQSIRDALTGLYNRRYMEETLAQAISLAVREEQTVGVIMIDIDHFKAFNDLAGHDGGDALLRQLGAYLAKNVRRFDTVCRYGGEEFLIILPKISALNAQHLAEKLRQGVKKLQVQGSSGLTLQCTISLGIALYPQTAADTETLIKAADEALYRAKNNGRDQSIIAL